MIRNPVRVGQLANGLRFYTWPGYKVNLSAIGVRAGSVHAPKGKVGLPHLVEHLLARHSSNVTVQEINRLLLEHCGGPDGYNIRIGYVDTLYGHDMTARPYQMRKLLRLFAELLEARIIDAESVAVERAAVHQEYWLRSKDVAETELGEMLRVATFGNHPISLRVDGEIPDLKSITSEDIKRFITRHYVAPNMFALILGPSYKESAQLAKELFGHWPNTPAPSKDMTRFQQTKPMSRNTRTEKTMRGIHQTHAAVSFRTGNFHSSDSIIVEVLTELLAHNLRERLREENRRFDSGCYRVYGSTEQTYIHGCMSFQWASKNGRFCEEAIGVMLEEARKIADGKADPANFKAAKGSCVNKFEISWAGVPLDVAEMVVEATSNGDEELVGLHQYPLKLRAVTLADVQAAAAKYLTGHFATAIIRPS